MNNRTFANGKSTVVYTRDGYEYKLSAVRKIESLSGQYPYFSITGMQYARKIGSSYWQEDVGGCVHELIAEHFPELVKYIKWHLTSVDEPMCYIENSMYWAGHRGWRDGKKDSPPRLDYLESTCVWGALSGENPGDLAMYLYNPRNEDDINADKALGLLQTLNSRKAALMAAFMADMIELFQVPELIDLPQTWKLSEADREKLHK